MKPPTPTIVPPFDTSKHGGPLKRGSHYFCSCGQGFTSFSWYNKHAAAILNLSNRVNPQSGSGEQIMVLGNTLAGLRISNQIVPSLRSGGVSLPSKNAYNGDTDVSIPLSNPENLHPNFSRSVEPVKTHGFGPDQLSKEGLKVKYAELKYKEKKQKQILDQAERDARLHRERLQKITREVEELEVRIWG